MKKTPRRPTAEQVERWRLNTYLLLIGLIVFLSVTKFLLVPDQLSLAAHVVGGGLLAIAHALPLVLFVPGIRSGRARVAVWMSYVLLLYGVLAIVRVNGASLNGWIALIEALWIAALFWVAVRFVQSRRALDNGAL